MTVCLPGEVSLTYQLLWNKRRQIDNMLLWLVPIAATPDAQTIASLINPLLANARQPPLLRTDSVALLAELLDGLPPEAGQIVVTDAQLHEPALGQRVVRAAQRGVRLVWQGEPGTRAKPAWALSFSASLRTLSSDQALTCLRSARHRNDTGAGVVSPVQAGDLCDAVASRALAQHCLDQQDAAALLGWPADDVLFSLRHSRIGPDRQLLAQLLKAIDADAPADALESLLSQDPLLAYRFLRYANSAGVGLRRDIDALRQGMMVLGLSSLKSWLQTQRHTATNESDLQPVRRAVVLRAHFMRELLDAGQAEGLKRELFLCGLLSNIDGLLGESMAGALHGLPLPQRVGAALLQQSGPYWPYLQIAVALETPLSADLPTLCQQHGLGLQAVNQALLRTLGSINPSHA